jgi:hypothetical protein
MPIRTPTPTDKTFYFNQGPFDESMQSNLVRVTPPEPYEAFLRIRQGTGRDNERRGDLLTPRKWEINPGKRTVHEMSDVNPISLAKLEMSLVIMATDIEHRDGSALKFNDNGTVNEADFSKWWDALPERWQDDIYACLLEVNPNWGMPFTKSPG